MASPGESSVKGIAILGSTGSIGTNTLRVIERLSDRFKVVSLAAGSRIEELARQIAHFQPRLVSVQSEIGAQELGERFPDITVRSGISGMVDVATHTDVDLVVSAVVGAVGLVPTLRAIEAGKNMALANKEVLVVAGEIITRAVKETGVSLLPVDSEHNAIHQCLAGRGANGLRRI